jgi:hypothetical protein
MRSALPVVCALLATEAAFATPDGGLSFEQPTSRLEISFGMMYRYTASVAPEAPDPADDLAQGFAFRRLRPIFEGDLAEGKITYFAMLAGETDSPEVIDAFLTFEPAEDWRIRLGQFRLNFSREMSMSSSRQLAADRGSIANNINPGQSARVQGVEARWASGRDRVHATLSEGVGHANTAFNDRSGDWGATLRYERLLVGEKFKQFDQFSAPFETPRGLMLGLAGHAQHEDDAGDRVAWAADLSYQDSGFNAALIHVGHVAEDRNQGAFPEPESLFGVVALAGLFITDTVEPFARYEWGTTSDEDHPDLNLITVGVNWYIAGQALKFTTDFNIAFDGVGPAFDRPGDGLIRTPDGDTRYYLRSQILVLF